MKRLLITLVFIIPTLIIINSCGDNRQTVPVYTPIGDPPTEITVEQVITSYLEDDLSKYKDRKLYFSGIVVEKINTVFIDSANVSYIYPVNNIIEFRPRYRTDTELVREGYVIDIVGEVRGVFGTTNPFIIIDDCWVAIIEGDPNAPPYEDPDY